MADRYEEFVKKVTNILYGVVLDDSPTRNTTGVSPDSEVQAVPIDVSAAKSEGCSELMLNLQEVVCIK